jgi:sec-independent protein translocase protein TatA
MIQPTILAALGAMEITLIVLVVLLLFGGKKIPELMRGLGKGMKEFKDGKDGVDDAAGNNSNNTNNQN